MQQQSHYHRKLAKHNAQPNKNIHTNTHPQIDTYARIHLETTHTEHESRHKQNLEKRVRQWLGRLISKY